MTARGLLAGLLAAAAAAGCCPPYPRTILPVEELIARHNANAAKVPRLWARAEFRLVVDGWRVPFGTYGYVILDKGDEPLGPHDLVVIGREAGQDVFRLGNSTEEGLYYWWFGYDQRAGGAFGRTELAGAADGNLMPIDPLGLLSVLTVCEVPADPADLPAALVRLDDADCRHRAYVVGHVAPNPLSGRIALRREVRYAWDDERPARPFRVDFLDRLGRRVMEARLADYRPVAMEHPEAEANAPAVMPTDIEITRITYPPGDPGRPQSKHHLRIRLSEMTTAEKVPPEAFLLWQRLPASFPRSALTDVDAARRGRP
jgi:hypothetical protein